MNPSLIRAANRRSLGVAGGVLVIAVGALVASGSASHARASSATLISFVSVAKSHDHTRSGFPSTGDVVRRGETVGTDVITCTFTRHRDRCRIVVTLARGAIVASFTATGASTAGTVKVVDGTGAYKDATGTGTYRYLNRPGTPMAVALGLT
jgi:hypothetical protein